nr:hypothetical protein 2 [Halomonadaceae bacterium]
MPLTVQLAADIAGSPLTLAATLISAGIALIYKLHPEWKERRRQASINAFNRLCDAYTAHKSDPDDVIARAKLGYCAEEYCRTPVNHRLIDMAFKSENTVSIFDTLRKLQKEIFFEDGVFKKAFLPYTFPTKKTVKYWMWITFSLYLAFCAMLGGSYSLFILDILTLQQTIGSAIASIIPAFLTIIAGKITIKTKRLEKIADLIRTQMPECI